MLLNFSTAEDLSAFLDRLRHEEPDLFGQVKASFAQPTVLMVRSATPQEERRILSIADPSVQAFADVQFKVM